MVYTRHIASSSYNELKYWPNVHCAGLVDDIGYAEQPSRDGLPYLTLYYANGPGTLGRTNLTQVDTG